MDKCVALKLHANLCRDTRSSKTSGCDGNPAVACSQLHATCDTINLAVDRLRAVWTKTRPAEILKRFGLRKKQIPQFDQGVTQNNTMTIASKSEKAHLPPPKKKAVVKGRLARKLFRTNMPA